MFACSKKFPSQVGRVHIHNKCAFINHETLQLPAVPMLSLVTICVRLWDIIFDGMLRAATMFYVILCCVLIG